MAKKTRTVVVDKGWDKIKRNIKELGKKKYVAIGFFPDQKYPDGTPVAQVGFWNEYGTSKAPERPFLRGWRESEKKEINSKVEDIKNAIFTGKNVDSELKEIGEWGKGRVSKYITDLQTPPNAPSTIAKKGKNDPLVDTGRMRDSVEARILDRRPG